VTWWHVEVVRELRLPPTAKLVLYALASRANPEDRCWPSIATLAADTGLKRRAVQLHVGRLVKRGAIVREVRPGRSNALRLDLQALLASASTGSSASQGLTGGQLDRGGRTSCTP